MNRDALANDVKNALKKLAESHESAWTVNDLRILLALERIVARLEADPQLSQNLIFKGGFVLLKMIGHSRFTRDLDALGDSLERETIKERIPKALDRDLNDGFWFGDCQTHELEEAGQYGTLRFDYAYQIGEPPAEKAKVRKLSRIHLDIGFGDKIPKDLRPSSMPSMIPEFQPVSWVVYPLEYIFSEKLQTLVERGPANSRAKDIWDIIFLSENRLDEERMVAAIQKTFGHRQTQIPKSFETFSKELDAQALEIAWPALQVKSLTDTFDRAWTRLNERLRWVDGVMKKF